MKRVILFFCFAFLCSACREQNPSVDDSERVVAYSTIYGSFSIRCYENDYNVVDLEKIPSEDIKSTLLDHSWWTGRYGYVDSSVFELYEEGFAAGGELHYRFNETGVTLTVIPDDPRGDIVTRNPSCAFSDNIVIIGDEEYIVISMTQTELCCLKRDFKYSDRWHIIIFKQEVL